MAEVDYLILGGDRHGDVQAWEFARNEVTLPDSLRLGVIYSSITFESNDGNTYALAVIGNPDDHPNEMIEDLIRELNPRPIQ